MKIHAVIHIQDRFLALRQFAIAREAGVDGVFFISHHNDDRLVMELAADSKAQHPDFLVGVNLLSTSPHAAAVAAVGAGVDMFWSDDMGVDSMGLNSLGKTLAKLAQENQRTRFFASVAFKYRPAEPHPEMAASAALAAGFVPTTSVTATGQAPTVEKIRGMSGACEGALAVASGMTPENIADYAPYLAHVLVATGVSIDDYRIDPERLALFIANARHLSGAELISPQHAQVWVV